jgi:hypothetical protein
MEQTFEQIAKEMGLSMRQVHWLYRSGMAKLKHNHPKTLQMLLSLASELPHLPLNTNEYLD